MTQNPHTNPLPGDCTPDTKRQKAFIDAVVAKDAFVRGYLFSLCRHDDVAKDVAQKTWLFVYRSFKEKDFASEALLKRKAWQLYLNHCRALKTRAFVTAVEDIEELAPAYVSKEQEGSEAEAAFEARFWERFLPLEFEAIDRQMFMLKERYGYTGEEIAAKVGLPLATVFSRIERLKRAAKEQLEKDI